MLNDSLRRADVTFNELFYAGGTSGFSLPMLVIQVPLRVVPGVMYVGALLVLADKLTHKLNRLQVFWARFLLGCRLGPWVRWQVLAAQCGWFLRLGVRVQECAIVGFARLQLLPDAHPGGRMVVLSLGKAALGWATTILGFMLDASLPGPIVDVLSHHDFLSSY